MAEKGFYDSYVAKRNYKIAHMAVFDGQLFAGTGSWDGYPCQVWRSNFPASSVHLSLTGWKPVVVTTLVLIVSMLIWKFKSMFMN